MKKSLKILTVMLVLVLCSSFLLMGCDKIFPESGDEFATEALSAPDYSNISINAHVNLGEYKNMTVDARRHGLTKDIVLWNTVVDNAEIIKYPAEALSYYEEQSMRRYMHYADEGDMTYDELIASLGLTQSDIEAEARGYVKSDLVKLAIIEAEGLHLTDDEKAKLFDKYVYKFATAYGYTVEYVIENLESEIYDSMQYDKMMEFLLLNNELITLTEE